MAAASEVPSHPNLAAAREWILGASKRLEQRVAVDFVVEREGAIVGEVGLGPIDVDRRAAFIGYWVFESERGSGIATEALAELIRWVGETGEFDVLLARTTTDNAASIAVLERNGFSALRHPPKTWARQV